MGRVESVRHNLTSSRSFSLKFCFSLYLLLGRLFSCFKDLSSMVVSDLYGGENLTIRTVRSRRAGTDIDNFKQQFSAVRLFTRLKGFSAFSVEGEGSVASVALPVRVKQLLGELNAS
jgi:hypothetical protein